MAFEDRREIAISQANEHPEEPFFKAQDRFGNVYLVRNPQKLHTYEDKQGRVYVVRPKPQLIEKGPGKRERRDVL